MKRNLLYHGKPIEKMSKEELEKQLEDNKTRMGTRTAFFGIVTVASCFVFLPIALIPLTMAGLTDYWIVQNNKQIKNQLIQR